MYEDEDSVGKAIKECGVSREELFVTSKLNNTEHGYEKTMAAFEGTMEKLGLKYLDLFLIHWPNPIAFRDHWQEANAGTWKAFEELYKAGRVRAIGISNFRQHHIEALMETATVPPMVNQMKLCPRGDPGGSGGLLPLQKHSVGGLQPLGTGQIFQVPEMQELARKYGRSIAQICIRWSLQRGYLQLPKSVNPARIQENANVFDFELEASDVQLIADLKGCVGYASDPDTKDILVIKAV